LAASAVIVNSVVIAAFADSHLPAEVLVVQRSVSAAKRVTVFMPLPERRWKFVIRAASRAGQQ
jgi:hypothetical protein